MTYFWRKMGCLASIQDSHALDLGQADRPPAPSCRVETSETDVASTEGSIGEAPVSTVTFHVDVTIEFPCRGVCTCYQHYMRS